MGGKRLARIAAAISLLAMLTAFADVALIASNVPKAPKEEPLPVIYDKPLDKPAEVPVYLQADERWGFPMLAMISRHRAAASRALPWHGNGYTAKPARRRRCSISLASRA